MDFFLSEVEGSGREGKPTSLAEEMGVGGELIPADHRSRLRSNNPASTTVIPGPRATQLGRGGGGTELPALMLVFSFMIVLLGMEAWGFAAQVSSASVEDGCGALPGLDLRLHLHRSASLSGW